MIPLESSKGKDSPHASTHYDYGIVLSKREQQVVTDFKPFKIGRLVGMENHPQADRFDEPLNMPRKLGPPEHRHRTFLRLAHRLGADVEHSSLRAPLV